jgi:predicted DNA-binding protein
MTDTFLSIRIPRSLADQLAEHKKRTGCPTSETVRRALKGYLEPKEEGAKQ